MTPRRRRGVPGESSSPSAAPPRLGTPVLEAPVLEARGLVKSFGQGEGAQRVVDGVDLVLRPGETVALLGASGSGKSTLLNLMGLLMESDEGELEICGEPVGRGSAAQRSRSRLARISHVFQAFHLIEHKTVAQNVELPLIHAGIPRGERREAVQQALDSLGMGHRAQARPSTLSGGEKQRVAIARAIVTRPSVLLCDEPTGSLDSARTAEVVGLLRAVTRADSATVIVTHDPSVAARCDRVLRLVDGRIAEGSPLSGEGEGECESEAEGESPSAGALATAATARLPAVEGPSRSRARGARWALAAWGQAWNAFTGRFSRNLFTMSGVALGVAALVLSVGFAATVAAQVSGAFDAFRADRVTVAAHPDSELTPAQAVRWAGEMRRESVLRIEGVEDAAPVHRLSDGADLLLAADSGQRADLVSVDGTTADGLKVLGVEVSAGRPFDEGHVARRDQVALVSERVFQRWGVEWTPGAGVVVGGVVHEVIGVVTAGGGSAGSHAEVYLPLGSDAGYLAGKASLIAVVRPGAASTVAAQIPRALDPARPERIAAGAPPEPASLRQAVDRQQQSLLVGMSALTLFIAGIGIMNTFVVAVMERRAEIGLRMALGAPPRAVAAQFCWEAVLTALGGSVLGVAVSVNALFVIAAVNGWTPVLAPTTVLLGLGAGLVVGTGAGILPSVRAARVEPVASLHQG